MTPSDQRNSKQREKDLQEGLDQAVEMANDNAVEITRLVRKEKLLQQQIDAIDGALDGWESESAPVGRVQTILNLKADRQRKEELERYLRWIWRTCRRNLNGKRAATYLGILNFIERNMPEIADVIDEEERAARAAVLAEIKKEKLNAS